MRLGGKAQVASGDAVVPSLTAAPPPVVQLQFPQHPAVALHTGSQFLFDKQTTPGINQQQTLFDLQGSSLPAFSPGLPKTSLVPQVQQPSMAKGLTSAQQSELEMARRRAVKAAEGKKANALAARRAKRKAERGDDDSHLEEELNHEQEQHIEAQIASAGTEKEAKRLKRLLRNRVSAQQARERKKSYLTNLEDKAREQDQQVEQLQQRVKTLERENVMLRQVIKNMQGRN